MASRLKHVSVNTILTPDQKAIFRISHIDDSRKLRTKREADRVSYFPNTELLFE